MPDIFGVDIAGILNDVLGPLVFDQTLVKKATSRDPADRTKRITVTTNHACKGFIDAFQDKWVDGAVVRIHDHKIVILGASLPANIVPEPGDDIIAEGSTFTIANDGVVRDPASATYECRTN